MLSSFNEIQCNRTHLQSQVLSSPISSLSNRSSSQLSSISSNFPSQDHHDRHRFLHSGKKKDPAQIVVPLPSSCLSEILRFISYDKWISRLILEVFVRFLFHMEEVEIDISSDFSQFCWWVSRNYFLLLKCGSHVSSITLVLDEVIYCIHL